jgi:creatinine amidohydrolase
MLEMNMNDFMAELSKTKTVIIPAGACEVWGPHLPLGADTLMAEEVANRLSERMGWPVGPTLPVGDSAMVWGPGTITIRPESFKMYLEDICNSLVKHGAKRFVFVSPHVAIWAFTQGRWQLKLNTESDCCSSTGGNRPAVARERRSAATTGIMAQDMRASSTSCFLYVRPDLVKPDRLKKIVPNISNNYPEFQQFIPFACYGDEYMLGDAMCASEKKGRDLVEATLDRMVEFLKQWNPPSNKKI